MSNNHLDTQAQEEKRRPRRGNNERKERKKRKFSSSSSLVLPDFSRSERLFRLRKRRHNFGVNTFRLCSSRCSLLRTCVFVQRVFTLAVRRFFFLSHFSLQLAEARMAKANKFACNLAIKYSTVSRPSRSLWRSNDADKVEPREH